jgi:hypothetical protein
MLQQNRCSINKHTLPFRKRKGIAIPLFIRRSSIISSVTTKWMALEFAFFSHHYGCLFFYICLTLKLQCLYRLIRVPEVFKKKVVIGGESKVGKTKPEFSALERKYPDDHWSAETQGAGFAYRFPQQC